MRPSSCPGRLDPPCRKTNQQHQDVLLQERQTRKQDTVKTQRKTDFKMTSPSPQQESADWKQIENEGRSLALTVGS